MASHLGKHQVLHLTYGDAVFLNEFKRLHFWAISQRGKELLHSFFLQKSSEAMNGTGQCIEVCSGQL